MKVIYAMAYFFVFAPIILLLHFLIDLFQFYALAFRDFREAVSESSFKAVSEK